MPIVITEAPKGTPAVMVPARTRRDLQTITVVAPVGRFAARDLTLDILTELGIRDDVAGRSSHQQDDVTLAPLWLRANETAWVVVTSPHVLPIPAMQFLVTLTLPAAATLLMVCDHGQATPVTEGLADYPTSTVPWDRISSIVPPPDTVDEGDLVVSAPHVWSSDDMTLPREDWPRFRSECRRLLHPQTFATVDAEYVRAFRQARAWLRDHEPNDRATAALLGSIVGTTANVDQATTAIRACQAAHMEAGWMLRIDLEKALIAISGRPADFTDTEWRLLRAYRDPHRSTAITLHQHGMSTTEMHTLTVADLAPDGSMVRNTPITPPARPYLRAQHLLRRADGATNTDPLLVTELRRTTNAVKAARRDLGLRVGAGHLTETENAADRWQRRLGVQLWDLR